MPALSRRGREKARDIRMFGAVFPDSRESGVDTCKDYGVADGRVGVLRTRSSGGGGVSVLLVHGRLIKGGKTGEYK